MNTISNNIEEENREEMLQVAVLCLGSVGAVVAMLVNSRVPDPYMDEVFHIPQVQAYCRGNFSHWDSMITTLPGLYLSSVAWLSPISRLVGVSTDSLCQPTLLRAQNLVSSLLILPCLYWLHSQLHNTSTTLTVLSSVNLALFPVLYFFSFLYYTDVGSTLLVLLGYALRLRGNHLLSASVLMCGVCFRQTSIVWLVFVAGTAVVEIIEPTFTKHTKDGHWMLYYPTAIVKSVLCHLPALVQQLWPYLVVVLIFALFVAVNGALVVGDKTNHVPCLHLPQFLYLALFTCLFSLPHLLLGHALGLLQAITAGLKWGLVFILIIMAGAYAVHYFTYAHPFLLADNRHYPFYLWKNVFRAYPNAKYWLLPLYSASVLSLLYTLTRTKSFLWILLFIVCCVITVVPQQLLEFRYYIIPYILYRLHVPSNYNSVLPFLAELLLYSCVNILTLYLFLYQPFLWPNSPEPQRFMW